SNAESTMGDEGNFNADPTYEGKSHNDLHHDRMLDISDDFDDDLHDLARLLSSQTSSTDPITTTTTTAPAIGVKGAKGVTWLTISGARRMKMSYTSSH
ncbi:hypothetical protein L0F63_005352, partial [Massospora cicadina]